MGHWTEEFNSVFFLSLGTMILGSFAVCLRYAYQSKCEDINLCGIIRVHRNINLEAEIDTQNHGEIEEVKV
jgi:hypothetical protein